MRRTHGKSWLSHDELMVKSWLMMVNDDLTILHDGFNDVS